MAYRAWNYTVKKTVVSSDITTTASNVFKSVGNGVQVEEVVIITDGTGLAGGTNIILKADWITFFETTVASLGADSVVDKDNATESGSKVIIPTGIKNISIESTVADCTGAGEIEIGLTYKAFDSNVRIDAL